MADQQKDKPSYCCAFYKEMAPDWQTMQDTCAGTRRLREQGELYLPREPAEQDQPYKYRLRRAIFFNAVDLTLSGLVGMVFRNDPKLAENVPEIIRGKEAVAAKPATEGQPAVEEQAAVEGHWENIDNAGTHGVVFAKELFADAMRDGHAAILVDYPPELPKDADAGADKGRRPNWVSYCADQIINWRTQVVNNKTKLTLVVFKEKTKEPDGEYGDKEVTRYRVLRPGSWELWREEKNLPDGQTIVFEDGGVTSLAEIPVAVVYSRKLGILRSQPPLLDLAMVNICHYQKYNDYSIYMHICSRPALCTKGGGEPPPVSEIGPYKRFHVPTDGDVWFAETTGAALGGAAEDIKALEERMSIMGLSLLVKRTGPQVTATEEKGDQIEESSDLATAARSLKDALELALRFHAQYLTPKATTGGNVEVGASLDKQEIAPEEMTAWSNAVAAGQFTTETMWKVFEAGGKLPDDFDAKVEKAALEAEAQKKQEQQIAMQEAADRSFIRGGAAEE